MAAACAGGGGTVRFPWGDEIAGFVNFSEYHSIALCLDADEILFLSRCAELVNVQHTPGSPAHVLDVGANLGVTGLYFSRLLPTHQVICFEPSPSTYASLLGNIARNRRVNVRCESLAVCDRVGEVSFDAAPTSRANAHIAETGTSESQDNIRVPSTTLDAFTTTNSIERVTLLKIDTEGHEHAVLAGADRLLSTQAIDVVYFEFCPALEEAAGSEVGAAVRLLHAHRYPSFAITGDGCLKPFDLAHQPLPALCNLVAISPMCSRRVLPLLQS